MDNTAYCVIVRGRHQVSTPDLKSAVLEAMVSALFYNAELTLRWAEGNNAMQVISARPVCFDPSVSSACVLD